MLDAVPGSDGSLQPPPIDRDRYVPALLTRMGERLAMRELSPRTRAAMTPLFVVHPIDDDPETGLPVRSVADHLGKLARQLAKDWGDGPAFVDLRFVDTSQPVDGLHAVSWFVQLCRDAGLLLAPVISGSHDPAYRAAAVDTSRTVGTAIALRLGPSEWPHIGTPLGDGHVLGLLGETGRPPAEVHLIIDIEQLTGAPDVTAAALRPALRSLPHGTEWASLVLIGTGMPNGTREIGRDGERHLPRLEWALWRSLNDRDYRRPTFGDYGVQSPDPITDFDPRYMDSAAQLRYTTANNWYVVRGRAVKASGTGQIHQLAARIVGQPAIYSGETYSWGDGWLSDCASHRVGAGNQGVWRKVTTNHHLTFVVDQLASHHGL